MIKLTIMDSTDFCYNGRYSTDFGIYNVSISGGMFDEPFAAKRSIVETKISGRDKPNFHGIDLEPKEFKLNFAFEHTWDNKKIAEVVRWLSQSYYKPLYFANNVSKTFYCIMTDEPRLLHNGLKQGYVTLTMRCNSSFIYSPVFEDGWYKSKDDERTSLYILNKGTEVCEPKVIIKKINNGDFSIINYNGDEFKFEKLVDDEIVVVDCERQDIETSLPNMYRYDNFNHKYLSLAYGKNKLIMLGEAKVKFTYQFKYQN
ncbi:hypothetical protein B7C51_25260 (plasmid) [Paenibacillus larvae subsp. pulvifaciens]|uniref:Phage tail-like C-terminal domain-containing protein n=2 Tax=Paenibacillus larvae TaxID=1464 RepID=A0A1V0UZX6_9BACL|nr:hypothetical protein B7C51_25260 [Paenibacillus larvae subsp. pulvifaciens]